MRTRKTVKNSGFSLKNGGTSHLINASLDMSLITVKKDHIKFDADGAITGAQTTASGHPKLEVSVIVADQPTLKTKLVLYGSSIPGLLALDCEETESELIYGAAYDQKSAKWSSNTEIIDTLMTKEEPVLV